MKGRRVTQEELERLDRSGRDITVVMKEGDKTIERVGRVIVTGGIEGINNGVLFTTPNPAAGATSIGGIAPKGRRGDVRMYYLGGNRYYLVTGQAPVPESRYGK